MLTSEIPTPMPSNCTDQIDDIEELGSKESSELVSQTKSRNSYRNVAVKSFRRKKVGTDNENDVDEGTRDGGHADHFLPGRATVFVKTWGCGHNNSDGEYMAGLLASNGYNVVLEDSLRDTADLWLLNSCTVKGPSEQTFVNDIRKGKANGKKVVVAGCVPQAQPKGEEWKGLSVVGVQQIDGVVGVVEETLKGNSVRLLKERKEVEGGVKRKVGGARLDLPKVRRNPYIEIIPINTGCLNQCTYCKTKHARGDLGSYSPEEIVNRVESVLDEGVMEIWLTSEDTGAYGRDIGVSIVDLLWGIVYAMESHPNQSAMLRVGMTNPPYILEHIEEIAKILSHPRVFAFLHVPVQAASNKVLEDMRRMYTQQDFRKVVDVLRERVDGVTIATDVICGFPTETEADFTETLDLCREYKFPVLHISQFYPRPGTPAARLLRLPTEVVKSRSRELTRLFDSYMTNSHALDTVQRVLITDRSGDGKHFVGHNKSYQQVLVPAAAEEIMGRMVAVKVKEVNKWSLVGEVVEVLGEEGMVRIDKGVPRLVRKGREIIRMKGGEGEGDGTELSLGSGEKACCGGDGCCGGEAKQDELTADIKSGVTERSSKRVLVSAAMLVYIIVLSLLIWMMGDMRWSMKVAVLVIGLSVGWEGANRILRR